VNVLCMRTRTVVVVEHRIDSMDTRTMDSEPIAGVQAFVSACRQASIQRF
jgi:hypothetical protein